MARLSNKLGEIVVTSNPQTAGLAGEIRPFAGDTSAWPVVDGVRQLKGWAVCEGAVLEQADYPDLFENIDNNWDNFAHPVDGSPIVGAGQFALPNLKGLFLGGAGTNGDSTLTLGTYADDKTSANGLNATTTVGGTSFSDTVANVHRASSTSVANFFGAGNNSNIFAGNLSSTGINNHTVGNFSISANGTTATADRNAAITGDAETRPKTAPVSYIIALYNNVANVITTKDFTADTVTSTGDVTVGGNIVGGEATASQAGTVSTGAQTFAGQKTFQDGISGTLTGNVSGNVTGSISGGTVSGTSYSNLPVASDSSSGILSTGAQTFAGEKIFQDGARINGISAGGLGGKISNIKTTLSPSTGNLATLSTFTMSLNTVVRVEVYGFDTTGTTGHNGVLLAMCNSGGNGRFRILNDLNSSLGGSNQGFTISVSNQVITIKNKNSMTYGQSAFVVFTAYS